MRARKEEEERAERERQRQLEEEDRKRREEQAEDLSRELIPVLLWSTGVGAAVRGVPEWQMSEETAVEIGKATANVLVKYFDLSSLLMFKEEVALGWLLMGWYARGIEGEQKKAKERAVEAEMVEESDNAARGSDTRPGGQWQEQTPVGIGEG